jgi:hypothetical protein
MKASFESELDKLVVENWGLIHALQRRAKALRDEILEQARERVAAASLGSETPAPADIVKWSGSWYLPFTRDGRPYVSYIDVKPKDEDPPHFVVYTGFAWQKGVSYSQVKAAFPDELRQRYADCFDDSSKTVATTRQRVLLDPNDPSATVDAIARAVIDQVPAARALFHIVSELLDSGVAGDGAEDSQP